MHNHITADDDDDDRFSIFIIIIIKPRAQYINTKQDIYVFHINAYIFICVIYLKPNRTTTTSNNNNNSSYAASHKQLCIYMYNWMKMENYIYIT